MPRFSVIIPDYEGAISRDVFRRCMRSLQRQTFTEFEALCYHDGPKQSTYQDDLRGMDLDERFSFVITKKRFNDWGHSLRDMGIRAATGDYIVHLNADNILYPHALKAIDAKTREDLPPVQVQGRNWNNPDIIVFPIVMKGMTMVGEMFHRIGPHAGRFDIVMSGLPPKVGKIDAMQLVMRRELWLAEGGWFDKRKISDSLLYRRFVNKYGMRYLSRLLGEHW